MQIKGGLSTKVYLVTLGGFDTHATQVESHDFLMEQIATNMKSFYEDLEDAGMQDNVLSMTFSEFGRRIEENGSQGTDHGAASPIMFFGPALDGNGFIGEHPDMQNPDNVGNLAFGIDFRSVYKSVLQDWLCIDPSTLDAVFQGEDYETLNLGFSCATLSVPTVSLYNLLGQEVGILANDFMFEGPQKINVKQAINKRLFTGQYFYNIRFEGKTYSKSILIS